MEITIIYGTETGNSESLAQDARAKLTKLGHQAKVVDMEGMTVEQLKNAGTLLVITRSEEHTSELQSQQESRMPSSA